MSAHALQQIQGRMSRALEQRAWPEALQCINKLLRFFPENAYLHYNQGLVFKYMEKPEASYKSLKRAINLDFNHNNARFELGVNLFEQGRYKEAAETFERCLRSAPNDSNALFHLGNALLHSGRPEAALSHLRKAHEIKPTSAISHSLSIAERELL